MPWVRIATKRRVAFSIWANVRDSWLRIHSRSEAINVSPSTAPASTA